MSQPLSIGEFDRLTVQEIEELDITDVADDNEEGYILLVDLQCLKELHDLRDYYPLAPEKMKRRCHYTIRTCRNIFNLVVALCLNWC